MDVVVRSSARCPCNDHTGRHQHGHVVRSGARHAWRLCAHCPVEDRSMHNQIRQWLETAALVPVLRARSAKEAFALVTAMVAGGVTVIEVTMTVPGAIDVLRQ